jgi:hypothetical protein
MSPVPETAMSIRSLLLSLCLVLSVAAPAATSASVGSFVVGDGQASGTQFGLNAEWTTNPVPDWGERLGMMPAAYTGYLPFPVTETAGTGLQRFVDDVAAVDGMAILRVEPTVALAEISDSDVTALAAQMADVNGKGVSVLLVFAPEMNGSWTLWSQQPLAYVDVFRQVADAVHATAPETAMVWSPNYGGGYPFRDFKAEAGDEISALDTNGDGQVTGADDPYAPYYPGDGYVDWSGLTHFHWGGAFPWGENEIPEPGKFVDQIRGIYVGANGDESYLPDFYGTYVETPAKPFMVLTSALYNEEAADGDARLDIKREWWRQVFSAPGEALPELRLVEWFERRQESPEANNVLVDWMITHDAGVREAFLEDLPTLEIANGAG